MLPTEEEWYIMKSITLISSCVLVMFSHPLWAECPYAHTHIGVNPTWRPASWDAPGGESVDPDPTDDLQLWFFSLPPVHSCATPGWPKWSQTDGSPFLLLSPVLEGELPIVNPADPNKTLYTCSFQYSKAGGYFAEGGKTHIDGWHSAHGPQGAWNLESVDADTVPAWELYLERVGVSDNLEEDDFFFLLPDDSVAMAANGDTYDLEKAWLSDKNAWGIHLHMGYYFWLDDTDDEVSVTVAVHDASGQYLRSADTTIVFAKKVIVPVMGDVNKDGVVDVNDMNTVTENFGKTGIVHGEDAGHADHDHDHGDDHGHSDFQVPLAWVWGYDADNEILTAYHSHGGDKRATFTASIHAHAQVMYSPSYPQNTFWMGKENKAMGFTAGFISHGNHGHMVTPKKFFATSECQGCIHMGFSRAVNTVAFANDDSQSFTLIDTVTGDVTTASHGSPHSSALVTDAGYLVGVHIQEQWARIIDPIANTVLAEIPVGGVPHGDAYHSATDRAFIAVDEGIEVIDIASLAKTGRIDYPAGPATVRTYVMYHDPTGRIPVAVGPAYDTVEDGPAETDRFFLIHMTDETIEAITISGATLDWSKGHGLFELSKNGRTAVFSDMNAPLLYVVDVDPSSATFRSVRTIPAPAPGVPVSVGAKGEHMFILSGTTVYPVDVDAAAVDMHSGFSVKEGTDWIFVTSYSGVLFDDSVDKGDEILNPEDLD
jgi:hypothetical protein